MKDFLLWVIDTPNPAWWLLWSLGIILFACVGMGVFQTKTTAFKAFYTIRAIGIAVGWWASFIILADIILHMAY